WETSSCPVSTWSAAACRVSGRLNMNACVGAPTTRRSAVTSVGAELTSCTSTSIPFPAVDSPSAMASAIWRVLPNIDSYTTNVRMVAPFPARATGDFLPRVAHRPRRGRSRPRGQALPSRVPRRAAVYAGSPVLSGRLPAVVVLLEGPLRFPGHPDQRSSGPSCGPDQGGSRILEVGGDTHGYGSRLCRTGRD